uniref:Uncharacterized protein n=1 Tax=Siphoviridae sp. ctr2f5 TaxID=2825684 RepID=A0A8S5QDS3_9CAUD|nr:MAG TPA: hypothetical protein [Siphoviridae sp. ctr2f5]
MDLFFSFQYRMFEPFHDSLLLHWFFSRFATTLVISFWQITLTLLY